MSSSPLLFGFESSFRANCATFVCPSDAAVALVHWLLVRRGVRVVGAAGSDEFSQQDIDGIATEILPDKWNVGDAEAAYNITIKYLSTCDSSRDRRKFLLSATLAAAAAPTATLVVNVLRLADEKLVTVSVDLEQEISSDGFKTWATAYRRLADFAGRLEALLEPLFPAAAKTEAKKEEDEQQGRRPPDPRPPRRDPDARFDPPFPGDPDGPGAWDGGASDLDPLGRRGGGGGGMMMPGPGGRRLGGGGIGPRIDPVHPHMPMPRGGFPGGLPQPPPGRGRFGDEMPPPGYGDDMFM